MCQGRTEDVHVPGMPQGRLPGFRDGSVLLLRSVEGDLANKGDISVSCTCHESHIRPGKCKHAYASLLQGHFWCIHGNQLGKLPY